MVWQRGLEQVSIWAMLSIYRAGICNWQPKELVKKCNCFNWPAAGHTAFKMFWTSPWRQQCMFDLVACTTHNTWCCADSIFKHFHSAARDQISVLRKKRNPLSNRFVTTKHFSATNELKSSVWMTAPSYWTPYYSEKYFPHLQKSHENVKFKSGWNLWF